MSVHDERELRDRLTGLLDGLEPSPAPVASAVRRGKGIRMRRWISVGAGLAVIVTGAALLPGLLQPSRPAPAGHPHYKVTVQPRGRHWKPGLVGQGTIDGRRWQVVLDRKLGDGCSPINDVLTCGPGSQLAVGRTEVSFEETGGNGTQFLLGDVGARVTRVLVQLSNGSEMRLMPTSFGGKRWVALAAPDLAIRSAVSFAGNTELAHAIPFVSPPVGTVFSAWLRPGQAGPARAAFTIGAGTVGGRAWTARAYVGPWGVCLTGAGGGSVCTPSPADLVLTNALNSEQLCGLSGPADWYGGKVAAAVHAVRIRLSDGSSITAHPVRITGGAKLYVVAVPTSVKYVRWTALDAAGRPLGAGTGWHC